MSCAITPAQIRDLVDDAFTTLRRRGADDAVLAGAALEAIAALREAIGHTAGPAARDQFDAWLAELLLRRELRARHFGLAPGTLPQEQGPPPKEVALAVALLVEAVMAHAQAAGAPVLALAAAEFLLERLERHGGGLPPRARVLARLAREPARPAAMDDPGHVRLH